MMENTNDENLLLFIKRVDKMLQDELAWAMEIQSTRQNERLLRHIIERKDDIKKEYGLN